jgi:predicted TIM-barrel fold metal-dependent hydrolase
MSQRHHEADPPATQTRTPANRLGLKYREPPPRRTTSPIVDVHSHVHNVAGVEAFFEAARLYGVSKVVSMTPLDEVPALRDRFDLPLEFIAIPRWREMAKTGTFQQQWIADLTAFRAIGARRMKFWMAPPMRGQYGLTLRDPFFDPLIAMGVQLGFDFMVHIGDPSEWFTPSGRYADMTRFGTKYDQYPQLEHLLDRVAPRNVIGAHMGGFCEEPAFLQGLLDRHANYYLDCSATKWVVRAVARQPEAIRDFVTRNADRILFGSDLVIGAGYDFDHYASRYWAQRMMWESEYRGESPIEDPDAGEVPRLAGVNLPAAVLDKLYSENAARLGY